MKPHRSAALALHWLFGLILLAGVVAPSAKAQDDPLESIGIRPVPSMLPVQNGYVDLANGDLHLDIPLASLPQRGGGQLRVALIYDSAIWTQGNSLGWTSPFLNGYPWDFGWRVVTSADPGGVQFSVSSSNYCPQDHTYGTYTFTNYSWMAGDGSVYSFPGLLTQRGITNKCGTHPSSWGGGIANNASGYSILVEPTGTTVHSGSGKVVYSNDSTVVPSASGSYPASMDSNGNYISHDSNGNIIDTLGRTLVTTTVNGSTTTIAVLNSKGTTSTYTVTSETINVWTDFASVGSGLPDYKGTPTVIKSVSLPDGSSYSFTYDSGTTQGHYGQLASMTLPTGGVINYSFANFDDSMWNIWGKHVTRGISTLATIVDGTSHFTPAVIVQCLGSGFQVNCQQSMTAAAPWGDNAVYTFILNAGAWPTEAQYYTGSVAPSNLLASMAQAFDFSQCRAGCNNGDPSENVTKTSATLTLPLPSGVNLNRTTKYTWDTTTNYGNLLQQSEWNFYAGSLPGSADRTTAYTYLNGSSYISANILNRPASATVTNKSGSTVAQTINSYDGSALTLKSGITHHYDANYGTGNTVRGNLTQSKRLVSGTSNYIAANETYDTTGQLITSTDPMGHSTTYNYTDNFFTDAGNTSSPAGFTPPAPTNAYLKTVTQGPLVFTFGYYWGTGQKALSSDPNSQTTYYHFYDPLDRPTSTKFPDGGWSYSVYGSPTQIDIGTGIASNTLTTGCPTTSNACRHDQVLLDVLGRVSNNILVSDPEGQTTVTMAYDSRGRLVETSNPYRSTSDPTYGIEKYSYDGLDRAIQVQRADGSVSKTYYGAAVGSGGGATSQLCSSSTYGLGYPILYVDEAGKKRQSWIDGLGRLIEVDEPNVSGTLSVPTCYSYDLNNNLTGVVQGTETRSFVYDLISRLTSSTNPESGTMSYSYDNNGNVLTKTSPAPNQTNPAVTVTTSYQYDTVNRLTKKSYSDGTTPTVNFLYDVSAGWGGVPPQTNLVGRMSEEWTVAGTVAYSGAVFGYDPMGRVTVNNQCTPLTCGPSNYPVGYAYDLAGDMISYSNGAGETFTQAFDSATHVTSVTSSLNDSQHPAILATITQFFPSGAPELLNYGNNLKEINFFNNRLQLCRVDVNTSTPTMQGCGDTIGGGVIWDTFVYYNSGQDNGNVTLWEASDAQVFHRTYTYDQLNRVSGMTDSQSGAQCGQMSFGYDIWGNLLTQTPITGTCPNWSQTATKNQISGFSYDAAGNLLGDGTHKYFYDAENRIIQVDGVSGNCAAGTGSPTACYLYDAEGRRVEKKIAGVARDYTYNPSGQVLGEIGSSGLDLGRIYLGGSPVAVYENGTTYFIHRDHLGSTRVMTNLSQAAVECDDYFPFGELIPCGTTTNNSHKFTEKERDQESNIDNSFARYFSSQMGRMMSPDPSGIFLANLADPQQLNLYSYVRNNPLAFIDPSGLDCIYFNDEGNGVESIDHNSDGGECGANGGDWVNGTTSIGQISYNSDEDMFTIGSSDSWNNYSTTASAPGAQVSGTPCYGDCSYSYSQSFRPNFTFQLGLALNWNLWGPFAGSGYAGFAVDSHGHIATYWGGGGGLSVGAGVSGGLQLAGSNGNSVCALTGPFANASGTGGFEVGGTADYFQGAGEGPGGLVQGGGLTLGGGGGAAGSVQATYTAVHPLGHACVNGKIQ